MNKEYHTTIFLTSHDISDIEKLCKRVIIINNGELVLDDTMENLKYHYLNKKIIDIKMRDEGKFSGDDKVKVLKQKGNNYKIEVDLDKTTIGEAMKSFDMDSIQDLNITNVPLEDIITTIYQRSK